MEPFILAVLMKEHIRYQAFANYWMAADSREVIDAQDKASMSI